MILATRFHFIVERNWENRYFQPKLAGPSATYDVISRNHSYWPSLNLSQIVREGWTNSYWKRQVLMFYPLGKIQKNLMGRGGGVTSTPLVLLRVKVAWRLWPQLTDISLRRNYCSWFWLWASSKTPDLNRSATETMQLAPKTIASVCLF